MQIFKSFKDVMILEEGLFYEASTNPSTSPTHPHSPHSSHVVTPYPHPSQSPHMLDSIGTLPYVSLNNTLEEVISKISLFRMKLCILVIRMDILEIRFNNLEERLTSEPQYEHKEDVLLIY